MSSFQTELLDFLKRETLKRPEESAAKKVLSLDGSSSIAEIVENYQKDEPPIHREKMLMNAFSKKEFEELGLSALYPRIYRGLPRIYHSAYPARSRIKRDFSDLAALKRLAAEKALFSLYSRCRPESDAKVCLFTWVIGDGYGDWIAAAETARLLQERFPRMEVQRVVLVPERLATAALEVPAHCFLVPYEADAALEAIPHEAFLEMRTSDLILFMPTFYPHTADLLERLRRMSDALPMPKIELLGEYGFIESSWFHPRSGNRSMGLHFLEKGILIRRAHAASFAEVKNKRLLPWLFKADCPGPVEIEQYLASRRFYLAYLTSPIGGAVYLHALLKSLEHDAKDVDLCVPDLGWFVQYIESQNRKGLPALEGEFGVQSLEVWFEGKVHAIKRGDKGKRVRILCPGSLSQSDFRALLSLSGEFAAVRGDQSFSEAVSANKVFFYDGREHARYFLKDLVAVAENRIAAHRGTLAVFRGMGKAFLHNLPEPEGEWVDETYFQEKEDWAQIALEIGIALQDPDTVAGFKKFNRILAEELSCNDFLCHFVQRALYHKMHPAVEQTEKEQVSLFSSNFQSFGKTVQTLEKKIHSNLL